MCLRGGCLLWFVTQLAILCLCTCSVFIETGEEALLERWGRPVAGRDLLRPGLHIKLPWPIDRIYRYSTGEIQSFYVGFAHDEKDEKQKTVLWTVSHFKDEFNLLVASRDTLDVTNALGGKRSPPVNLLSVSIPVQYQISNIRDWAYKHRDAAALLQEAGTREVVRYLVGVDLQEVMSSARFRTAEELRQRIQSAADVLELGAKILFVGLQDMHPPVKVAHAYEAVVGARQKKEAEILNAKAYSAQTNELSRAAATVRVNEAEAARNRIESGALARAALFTNQIPAFVASPQIYSARAYLQALVRGGARAKKIIMAATNNSEVIILDLQEKIRPDIFDIPLPKGK